MNKIRVLLAKIGQDSHDQGIKVVAAGLRDAGMEVIYTGLWQKTAAVVKAAMEEDVDVIGISSLSYEHLLVPRLLNELRGKGSNIAVIVGGVIPPDEAQVIKDAGVAEVFPPGSSIDSIVKYVRKIVTEQKPSKDLEAATS
ncbi:MAG: cobalamin-dependent protein [Chloroflexota bacterium]|nr:cobalamin-dependent protein [Chloroflexota bacterium]